MSTEYVDDAIEHAVKLLAMLKQLLKPSVPDIDAYEIWGDARSELERLTSAVHDAIDILFAGIIDQHLRTRGDLEIIRKICSDREADAPSASDQLDYVGEIAERALNSA